MPNGLIEIGEAMLSASQRRLEIVSRNITHASTPGFKKEATFGDALATAQTPAPGQAARDVFTDFSQGALRLTGNSFDLALSSSGFFQLRSAQGEIYYSRGGQFERTAEGTLKNAQGLLLQTESGGDLVIGAAGVEVLEDGAVLEAGLPVARLGLYEPVGDSQALVSLGGSLFQAHTDAMKPLEAPLVRQGMVEAANVDAANEMVEMMKVMRSAESAARIVQTYDSLIGQSISTFGQGGK